MCSHRGTSLRKPAEVVHSICAIPIAFLLLLFLPFACGEQPSSPVKTEPEYSKSTLQQLRRADSLLLAVEKNWSAPSDSLLADLYEALDIHTRLHDIHGQLEAYHQLGLFYITSGDLKKSKRYINTGIRLAQASADSSGLSSMQNLLGQFYIMEGRNVEALELYDVLLERGKRIRDTTGIIYALGNISYVHQKMGDEELGRTYLRETVKLAKADQNYYALHQCYVNLSTGFEITDSLERDSFLYYLNLAETSAREHDDAYILPLISVNYAEYYYSLENYDSSIKYAREVISMDDPTLFLRDVIMAESIMAKCYRELGNYQLSEKYFKQCLPKAYHLREESITADVLGEFSDLRYKTGQYEEGLKLLTEATKLREAIVGAKVKQRVSELLAEKEVRKTDEEIRQLKLVNLQLENEQYEKRRLQLFYGSMGVGLILIFFVNFYQINRANLERRDKLIAEGRLETLRAQMNPHFIFNAFSGIQNYILRSKGAEAAIYLDKFADLLTQVMASSENNFLSLESEIDFLRNYLDLEKMRFRDSFSYSIDLAPDLTDLSVRIPAMMIQPHVENALLHGLSHKKSHGKLSLRFTLLQDSLEVIVTDNGIGRRRSRLLKDPNAHLSIATTNTKKRLAFLKKIGYEEARVEIEDLQRDTISVGTRVLISLPLA